MQEQLQQQLAPGRYASEDEVLREALRALRRRDEDLTALREAIADMEAGDRGRPFDDFVEEFRRKHNIAQNA